MHIAITESIFLQYWLGIYKNLTFIKLIDSEGNDSIFHQNSHFKLDQNNHFGNICSDWLIIFTSQVHSSISHWWWHFQSINQSINPYHLGRRYLHWVHTLHRFHNKGIVSGQQQVSSLGRRRSPAGNSGSLHLQQQKNTKNSLIIPKN